MTPAAGAPWRVQIEGGSGFAAAGQGDTLLRTALRAGVSWPYECSAGGCGSCRFELLDGEVQDLWPEAPGLSQRERLRGKRLACQTLACSDLRVKVREDREHATSLRPARLQARLVARRRLTHDMCEFSFRTGEAARFLPGQYALVDLAGVRGSRAWSMSNLPNEQGEWQFIVRRVPGGSGTTALFEQLDVGQQVALDGPYGHAWLRPASGRDLVCVAGGSGLAPMLSITRAALASRDGRRVHLFLGARSQADLGCTQLLDDLRSDALKVTVVLSDPAATPAWNGATGFVHTALENALDGPFEGFDFYFAGPPPMIEAVQELLVIRQRVPHAQVHFDRFV